MNEVEKMYKNAGVEKDVIPCPAKYYGYNCTRNNWDDKDCSCDIEGYPPFTAEKQLELIKWLARSKNGIGIDLFGLGNPQGKTVWNIGVEFQWEDYNHTFEHKEFEQALAGLINKLWQDLTEGEKARIKEILE